MKVHGVDEAKLTCFPWETRITHVVTLTYTPRQDQLDPQRQSDNFSSSPQSGEVTQIKTASAFFIENLSNATHSRKRQKLASQ